MLNIASIDFETTGMIRDGGRAVEMAAVILDPDTLLPVEKDPEFQVFINPGPSAVWFEDAVKTHGYTKKFIEQVGLSEIEACHKFLLWLEKKHNIRTWLNSPGWWKDSHYRERSQLQMLGHNVTFDREFYYQLFGSGIELFNYKFLDTMQAGELVQAAHRWDLGFHMQPFRDPKGDYPSVSLVAMAAAFGIDISGAHGALADCKMCAGVWRSLVKSTSEDFAKARDLETYMKRGVN